MGWLIIKLNSLSLHKKYSASSGAQARLPAAVSKGAVAFS
jgi:hypothetical protein